VVDGSGLENRHTRKGIGGSNPSLSASPLVFWYLQAGDTYTDSMGYSHRLFYGLRWPWKVGLGWTSSDYS
jgi:hypothetical protein